MLRGVTHALQRLQARNVVGDMISVIGVDQNADIDIRTFATGSDYDLTRAKVGEPVFDEMLATFTDPPNLHKLHRDHFFFPREDAMFNLPEALRVAFTKLTSQPDYKMSDNNVIVLTDGLTECYKDASDNNVCATDQPTIEASIQQAIDYVQAQYIAAGIRFSVILTGGVVRPHTVGRKGEASGAQGECMTSKQAREGQLSLVDAATNSKTLQEALDAASADSSTGKLLFDDNFSYFTPNRLFDAVNQTEGVWAPLREPCQPQASQLLSGKSCSNGGLKDWLDTQCAALTTPGDHLSSILGSGGIPTRITDADGRIVCDPQCRTRNQQIRDYIDEIFDSNPYLELDQNVVVN